MIPKIPNGWYKLKKGTIIKENDQFDLNNGWYNTLCNGCKVGSEGAKLSTYIRRKKKISQS